MNRTDAFLIDGEQRYAYVRSSSRDKSYEFDAMGEANSSSASKLDWSEQRQRSAAIPTSYSGSALNRLLTEDEEFLTRKYFNGRYLLGYSVEHFV